MNNLCCTVNNLLTCSLCQDKWCRPCWEIDLTHCTNGFSPLKCPKAGGAEVVPLDPDGMEPGDLLVPIEPNK